MGGFGPPPVFGDKQMAKYIVGDTLTSSGYQILHIDEGPSDSPKTVYSGGGVATALKLGTESASVDGEVSSDVTVQSSGTVTQIKNFDSSFTTTGGGNTTNRYGYYDGGLTLTNGAVTNNYAFYAAASNVGATNSYGFYCDIPGGSNRWGFYAYGTAQNRFNGRTTFSAGFARIPTISAAPSGSTITLTTATSYLLYNNSSTTASLTIQLPTATWADGQEVTIATRSAITTLTIGAGSIPVYSAPTTLAAGGFVAFIYSSAANAWFRMG